MQGRVLVRPFTEDEVKGNKGKHFGIIIPETISKEKSAQGKVLAVGDGRWEDGHIVPMRIEVGDSVVFSKYGYDEVKIDDEDYYIIAESGILAVIK